MSDLGTALREATRRLTAAGVPSARHDAEQLAAHVLHLTRPRVVLAAARGDCRDLGAEFEDLVDARARRVPLQHLTGTAPFRDLVLDVGPGVFVPRPETEVVAQAAIDETTALVAGGRRPVVVDLCTGSGALALAVATEVPGVRVHAVELSPEAHGWAQRNIRRWAPGVDLRLGDAADACDDLAFEGLGFDDPDGGGPDGGGVDIVVSNPPYIPPDAVPVDPEVRDHDPDVALYGGGPDGLAVPRQVVATAARLLRPGGLLVVEHADVQQPAMLALLTSSGLWDDAAGHRDLTGRPRYVTARRHPH